MAGKIILSIEVFGTFLCFFWWIRSESIVHNLSLRAMRTLRKRTKLISSLDTMLLYSGLHRKSPLFTPQNWILLNILVSACICAVVLVLGVPWWAGLCLLAVFWIIQYLLINFLILRNYNATDENLLKFLDFLGNYSISTGEITSVMSQISVYLEEPLHSVLQEYYYEAQTLGDPAGALDSMAKKIQHPKFKELVRNIEVTMRYSADFTVLVNQSRKSIREYTRMRQERKALAKEAFVNMVILGGMTVVIWKAVESLVDVSVVKILLYTWAGRGCLMGITFIMLLFYRKVRAIDR